MVEGFSWSSMDECGLPGSRRKCVVSLQGSPIGRTGQWCEPYHHRPRYSRSCCQWKKHPNKETRWQPAGMDLDREESHQQLQHHSIDRQVCDVEGRLQG